jgi:hypothetical protein
MGVDMVEVRLLEHSAGPMRILVRHETRCAWCGAVIVRWHRPGWSGSSQRYCKPTHATNAKRARQKARGTAAPQGPVPGRPQAWEVEARLRAATERVARRCLEEGWTVEEARAAAEVLAEEHRRIVCPRPDKLAWGTAEGAAEVLAVVRSRKWTDPSLAVYQCVCGAFHLGRRRVAVPSGSRSGSGRMAA